MSELAESGRRRWDEARRLFEAALDLPSGERPAFVADAAADPALRRELLALLAAHETLESRPGGEWAFDALDPERAAALLREDDRAAAGEDDLRAVGPYELLGTLGRGGMGVVYLAIDRRLGRRVALKLLPPWLAADPRARLRLAEEARAASALDHPGIATVYDIGETAHGTPYIAMAYCPGETLLDRIGRGPLPVGEAVRIATRVAEALAAAHRAGIVHRDLKPSNVILCEGGGVRLIDFGIAKVVGSPGAGADGGAGTVAYMSPEQTRGEPVDQRADLWAVGVLLYEMLAGVRPFQGETREEVGARVRDDHPPPLSRLRADAPAALGRVIDRCLRKAPDERFASAAELLAALEPPRERPVRGAAAGRFSRRRVGLGAAAALTVGLAAATVWIRPGAAPPPGEPPPPAATPAVVPGALLVAPFTADAGDGEDDARTRLGRDLALVVAAGLDGAGALRTVDGLTALAQFPAGEAVDLARALAAARRLEAHRLVLGALLPSTDGVRVDATLYRVEDGQALAHASAHGATGEPGVLGDSLVWALLREALPEAAGGSTSRGALGTRSVAALRAFLEGERAIAEGRMREAPESFRRAIELDSTYWFAYWRYAYTRDFWSLPVEPEVRRAYREHRASFPEPDRLLIEATTGADRLGDAIERARSLASDYPFYWLGWFHYSDHLVHSAPFLGGTTADARRALERTLALNPDNATVWEHLFWMLVMEGDTAAMDPVLDRLQELRYDSAQLRDDGLDGLAWFRWLRNGAKHQVDHALTDSLVRPLVDYRGPVALDRFGGGASIYFLHDIQLDFARRLLEHPVPPTLAGTHRRSIMMALAGMGDWPGAMAAAEEYVRAQAGADPAIHGYRLAVAGEWLGLVDAAVAERWQRLAAAHAAELPDAGRAELAWLDGVRAATLGDREAVGAARSRAVAADTLTGPWLGRSLMAFELAVGGAPGAAVDSMAAVELERAQSWGFKAMANAHPFTIPLNRMALAGWALRSGRPEAATRFMTWYESVQFPAYLAAHADGVLAAPAWLLRARLARDLGRHDEARDHARRFLELYRRAGGAHPWVVEARRLVAGASPG